MNTHKWSKAYFFCPSKSCWRRIPLPGRHLESAVGNKYGSRVVTFWRLCCKTSPLRSSDNAISYEKDIEKILNMCSTFYIGALCVLSASWLVLSAPEAGSQSMSEEERLNLKWVCAAMHSLAACCWQYWEEMHFFAHIGGMWFMNIETFRTSRCDLPPYLRRS